MADLRVGVLAGEPSGDRLGAGLVEALRDQAGSVRVFGVGGEALRQAGLDTLLPLEHLTMHGFAEPIRRLPFLYRLLRDLEERLLAARIDVFVGVDFNVFNLLLERRLRRRGVPTVHYVSPSVYAWRRGRVRRVAASADLLLTLFPFEAALYAGQPLRVTYVGHPLADDITPGCPQRRSQAREALNLRAQELAVAVLPGSRRSELEQMLRPFLGTAVLLHQQRPDTRFLLPCVTDAALQSVRRVVQQGAYAHLPLTLLSGGAREALAAADLALVKSGTSTLEALLHGVPMVVGYRLPRLSYELVRRLLRTDYIALPNILAGEELVPEILQHDLEPARLVAALQRELNPAHQQQLKKRFAVIHDELRCGASANAARAVRRLLDERG